MRLIKLRLENFRCFEQLELDLHPRLTVLVANNGQGKTAILDGLAIGLGTFLTYLPNVPGIKPKGTDFRVQDDGSKPPYMRVSLQANDGISWDITERRDKTQSTAKKIPTAIGQKKVKQYALEVFDSWLNKGQYLFPMLAYYGTGRAVFDVPLKRRNFKKDFAINDEYHNSLEAKTNFRRFFEYFYFLEDLERRGREQARDWDYRQPELEVIREAIRRMMPEFSKPHSELRPLRLMVEWSHNNRKQILRIEQLSDGYRTTLAMVMDIATRLATLNPTANNPLDSDGIVLIDEVDLHLHPSWQQRILPDLLQTFPNVQFIVSTHSPQVLGTVRRENIRILGPDTSGRMVASQPLARTYGEPSGDVLHNVMLVDPQPPVPEKRDLQRLTELVDQGLYDEPESLQLMQKLLAALGEQHPQLQRLQRSIQRQQALKG